MEKKQYVVSVEIEDENGKIIDLGVNVFANSEDEAMDKADVNIREENPEFENSSIDVISVKEQKGIGGFVAGVFVGAGGTLYAQHKMKQKKKGKSSAKPRGKASKKESKTVKRLNLKARKAPQYLIKHGYYDKGDYEYLSGKGWSNKEIKEIWDRDLAANSKKAAEDGGKLADGGLTEHGLKVGDKIVSEETKTRYMAVPDRKKRAIEFDDAIKVKNAKEKEEAIVDLDKGKRSSKKKKKIFKGGGETGKNTYEVVRGADDTILVSDGNRVESWDFTGKHEGDITNDVDIDNLKNVLTFETVKANSFQDAYEKSKKMYDKNNTFQKGGAVETKRRFTENDYNKLVGGEFYSTKEGKFWQIKDEETEKTVASWHPQREVLTLKYKKKNPIINWLKENSYLSSEEYSEDDSTYAGGGGVKDVGLASIKDTKLHIGVDNAYWNSLSKEEKIEQRRTTYKDEMRGKGMAKKKATKSVGLDSVKETKAHLGLDDEYWNTLSEEEKIESRRVSYKDLQRGRAIRKKNEAKEKSKSKKTSNWFSGELDFLNW